MGAVFVLPTKVKIDDEGFALPIDLGESISNFDTVELILRTPADNFTTKVVVCAKDPDNVCQMFLPIVAATFDAVGSWLAQPKLTDTDTGEIVHGKQFEIEVVQNLS